MPWNFAVRRPLQKLAGTIRLFSGTTKHICRCRPWSGSIFRDDLDQQCSVSAGEAPGCCAHSTNPGWIAFNYDRFEFSTYLDRHLHSS